MTSDSETRTRIEEALLSSVRLAAGQEYVSLLLSTGYVRQGSRWTTSGDFETSCAKYIFGRVGLILPGKRKYRSLDVTTVSELGLTRVFSYSSPIHFAESIMMFLQQQEEEVIASMHLIGKEGAIVIVSKPHLEWHLSFGRIPCHICGHFFNGIRGLRMHQVLHHKICYEVAQREATESKMWIVEYVPDLTNMRRPLQFSSMNTDEGMSACKIGDLVTLRQLVNAGSWDPQIAVDKYGSSALMWAAGAGHLKICKFLVDECGVDISELKGKVGLRRHALHWASRNNHVDVCSWIVQEKQVNVDVVTDDGTTALHLAAYNGSLDTCKWLIFEGKSDINKVNVYGCNASQWCAQNGSLEIMKFFYSAGLNFSILNKNGHSALHKAAMKGNNDACLWLLTDPEEGGPGLSIDHMQADLDGFTPAMFALANGFEELGRYLSSLV